LETQVIKEIKEKSEEHQAQIAESSIRQGVNREQGPSRKEQGNSRCHRETGQFGEQGIQEYRVSIGETRSPIR